MNTTARDHGDPIGPYSSASDMMAALHRRDVSSVDLVMMHIERIEAGDGALNAIPVRTAERAIEDARHADSARMHGQRAAMLGLPITLKESTAVAGLPQSAGIAALKDYCPSSDGHVAATAFGAGACLLGKTNVPEALFDWQADSPVYGRTNNPWDHHRTPGGSTGGGAAALAAGLTPLEIGSDVGGSIRVPAAFCGVYGHRPSETAVPRSGGFPFADLANPAVVMPVQGPLARSARDLELALDVIAGAEVGEHTGWTLALPEARHDQLEDFRVAVMPPLPWIRPAREVTTRIDELSAALTHVGARVELAMPEVDVDRCFSDYLTLLGAVTSTALARPQREANAEALTSHDSFIASALASGMLLDAAEYVGLLDRREQARRAWSRFFDAWDVLLAPTTLDVAFPHQTGSVYGRTLVVDDQPVPYLMNLSYVSWATFAGLPATTFPAGLNSARLPLGLQAVGPYLEDRTTLRFAQLLEREWRRFQAPPVSALVGAR